MEKILLILFDDDIISAEQQALVREIASDHTLVYLNDIAEIDRYLDRIEIAAGRFPLERLHEAPRLRWLHQWGAGADWLLRNSYAQSASFVLTNTSGIHAIQIAEHVFAMLLAFGRQIPQAIRAQSEHIWVSNKWQIAHSSTISPGQTFDYFINHTAVFELAGKTMLIAGVGAIGQRTARLAKAFDMQVIGVRRHPENLVDGIDRMIGFDEMVATLPEADFVVNALPFTAETERIFNAPAFKAMKPTGIFVNIGRGGTHHEPDLVAALQNDEIAGAGLDVFESEPLMADSALWDLPNVLITSHYAGLSPVYDDRAFAIFIENLRRYVDGREMINVVDKQLGY